MKLYREIMATQWVNFFDSGIRKHQISYDGSPIVGYEEISDLVYLDELYRLTGEEFIDYFNLRLVMKQIAAAVTFGNLTSAQKVIAAKYCLYDDMTLVGYYMSLGDSQAEAITHHKIARAEDINNAARTCRERENTSVVKYIVIKYLSEDDSSAFLDAIRNFMEDYGSVAHLGLNYGQSREGLMDYIEATHAYTGGGLSQYTFQEPYTYEQCKTELKNYLVYGKLPIEYH